MNERWVCRRCFTSVDGGVGSCPTCGLLRGSEVPAGEHWTAAAVPAAQPRWRSLLRFWWIGLLVIAAGSSLLFGARRDEAGAISDDGDLAVTELRVGDCFDLNDAEEEVEQVRAEPCSSTHEYEMFFVGDFAEGGAFPSQEAFDEFVFKRCVPAFEEYVGAGVLGTELDILFLLPTEGSWSAGDTTIQCALYDPQTDALTGSLRDSER